MFSVSKKLLGGGVSLLLRSAVHYGCEHTGTADQGTHEGDLRLEQRLDVLRYWRVIYWNVCGRVLEFGGHKSEQRYVPERSEVDRSACHSGRRYGRVFRDCYACRIHVQFWSLRAKRKVQVLLSKLKNGQYFFPDNLHRQGRVAVRGWC